MGGYSFPRGQRVKFGMSTFEPCHCFKWRVHFHRGGDGGGVVGGGGGGFICFHVFLFSPLPPLSSSLPSQYVYTDRPPVPEQLHSPCPAGGLLLLCAVASNKMFKIKEQIYL
jgi:hypothetical protein